MKLIHFESEVLKGPILMLVIMNSYLNEGNFDIMKNCFDLNKILFVMSFLNKLLMLY